MSKTLSIIVPTLNEGAVIGRLLTMLQPLRSRGVELIVCDGGSRDATVECARPLADHLVLSQPGRARQMNRGAAEATGGWLWFVHADTGFIADPGEYQRAILGVSGCWGRFDIRLDSDGWIYSVVGFLINWRSGLGGIATGDQGIFVRRQTFEELGGFADIPLMEDVELSRRLLRRQRPARVSPQLLVSARRWQRHGVWRTILLMWRLRLAYFLGVDPDRLARVYRQCSSPKREY